MEPRLSYLERKKGYVIGFPMDAFLLTYAIENTNKSYVTVM